MTSDADYYQLLQIEKTATQDEIKKAYRALALQYHPDINPDETAEEHIKNLNQAYSVLADPEQRQLYDLYGACPAGRPTANGAAGQAVRRLQRKRPGHGSRRLRRHGDMAGDTAKTMKLDL